MTAAGIVSEARARSGASRTSAAPPRENVVPFWCLMFFTFVLFIAPQNIFPSLEPLRLAATSAGLAAVAYVLSRLMNRRPVTVVTPEVRLVLWFALAAVVSIPFSLSPGGSLEFFLSTFVKSVIVFFLIANLLETMRRLKLLVASIVLYGFIISATALRNFATEHTMSREPGRIWGYANQLADNAVDLALTLNVILALTIGLYFVARRRLVKVLLLAGMGLAVAGVIVSFSRGGFLGLTLIVAVLLARWVRARGPVALLWASALVVVGIFLAPDGYADRLYSLFDWDRDRAGSIQSRSQQMQVAFRSMLENPLIGAGLGMEGLVYVEKGFKGEHVTHSVFLRVGADLGLPGLLVYVLLFVQSLRGLRQTQRRLRPVPEAREVIAIASGLELAIYSFLVGASFLPISYGFLLFYLAGLAAAIRVIGARLAVLVSPTR
ncbi:MAG: O-antigen ligase family protein [Candidatus Rokubacteria bacterium]|nr:O-antigen ligase family protein [Candidatus Rokubacteria bacterium]